MPLNNSDFNTSKEVPTIHGDDPGGASVPPTIRYLDDARRPHCCPTKKVESEEGRRAGEEKVVRHIDANIMVDVVFKHSRDVTTVAT